MIKTSCTLIIGITSGIGSALAVHLNSMGFNVVGTARTQEASSNLPNLSYPLDLTSYESIDHFINLFSTNHQWNNIIFCPAVMSPIGRFDSVVFHEWLNTFNINFSNQAYLLHSILPFCSGPGSHVLFFAGGGTNSAPTHYSAYTLSKITLIKFVELLNEEIESTAFSILGPGWVKTKIHSQSLEPSLCHLSSYQETQRRLNESDFIDMDQVISSIIWILSQDKNIVGGRNFSTAHDPFDSDDFLEKLSSDSNVFKLRRHGNQLFNQTLIDS